MVSRFGHCKMAKILTGDAPYVLTIPLSVQEEEFAAACRDFVLEKMPDLGASIVILNSELAIANDLHVRQAFIEFGLGRLIRVLRLAIEKKSIPVRQVPKLIFDLSLFKMKILRSLSGGNKRKLAQTISSFWQK